MALCNVHTAFCTVCIEPSTFHTVNYTIQTTLHCRLHIVHIVYCTFLPAHCTLNNVHCTVHTVHLTQHTANVTLQTSHCESLLLQCSAEFGISGIVEGGTCMCGIFCIRRGASYSKVCIVKTFDCSISHHFLHTLKQ